MDIWRDYKRTNSRAARDRLIIHYMSGHVRQIAHRLHAQLPRQVDVDDLVDEAYDGLVDVIERFDIERGLRFETFSTRRILGAMRDYLRRLDTVPRLARTRSKRMAAAIERFTKINGRSPEAEELRQALDVPERRFRKMMLHARLASVVSLSGRAGPQRAAAMTEGDDRDPMVGLQDRRRPLPHQAAEHEDLRRWITQGFTRRDRLIIVLYYYEQMTMKEIGATLGCSESRVSQRLDSILKCLRARLSRAGGQRAFLAG